MPTFNTHLKVQRRSTFPEDVTFDSSYPYICCMCLDQVRFYNPHIAIIEQAHITTLPCKHSFHLQCILHFCRDTLKSAMCPICKAEIPCFEIAFVQEMVFSILRNFVHKSRKSLFNEACGLDELSLIQESFVFIESRLCEWQKLLVVSEGMFQCIRDHINRTYEIFDRWKNPHPFLLRYESPFEIAYDAWKESTIKSHVFLSLSRNINRLRLIDGKIRKYILQVAEACHIVDQRGRVETRKGRLLVRIDSVLTETLGTWDGLLTYLKDLYERFFEVERKVVDMETWAKKNRLI